jgi:hypothetical protein
LKRDIANLSGSEYQQLTECGFSESAIIAFRDALKLSAQASVDAFLEHREEFREIGRAAIAQRLMRNERLDELFNPPKGEQNWYEYLFGRLNAPLHQFSQNKLAVITFNYDRSLEAFLFTALKNTYGASDNCVADALRAIPIIHVHGQLGLLEWQIGSDPITERRTYDQMTNYQTIKLAAAGIRIIHEAMEMSGFDEAHQHLCRASRIYFLGFGYHPMNMERLRLDAAIGTRPVIVEGSFFERTGAEIEHLAQYRPSSTMHKGHPSHKVCQFLRESRHFQID